METGLGLYRPPPTGPVLECPPNDSIDVHISPGMRDTSFLETFIGAFVLLLTMKRIITGTISLLLLVCLGQHMAVEASVPRPVVRLQFCRS